MKKIIIASVFLIFLVVLEITDIFGAGGNMNVTIDNIMNPVKSNINYLYNGEFSKADWFGLVEENAIRYNIQPALILAIIKQESNGFIWSVSTTNAIGLMQVQPNTARWISQRKISDMDLFKPKNNIQIGSEYLQWLIGNFRGNMNLAIAGYNAGQTNALSYYRNNISGVRTYVLNVLKYQAEYEEEGL